MKRLTEYARFYLSYNYQLAEEARLGELKIKRNIEEKQRKEKIRKRALQKVDNRPYYWLMGFLSEDRQSIPLRDSFQANNDRQAIFETMRRLRDIYALEGYGATYALKNSLGKWIRTIGISKKGVIR